LPGRDFLALMIKAGFQRASLTAYTGFKTSPYTEGALFYGEKLVDAQALESITTQVEPLPEPKEVEAECAAGGA
jgi:hypothetical protein